MSDLQRSFAKAKLSNLPFDPPMPLNTTLPENMLDEEGVNEAEDGTLKPLPGSISTAKDDDSSSASSTSSTGTIMPEPSKHLFAGSKGFVSLGRFLISSRSSFITSIRNVLF